MSPEIDISVSETRSKFAFLFNSIAELYRFYYGKKLSTKFEDVKKNGKSPCWGWTPKWLSSIKFG